MKKILFIISILVAVTITNNVFAWSGDDMNWCHPGYATKEVFHMDKEVLPLPDGYCANMISTSGKNIMLKVKATTDSVKGFVLDDLEGKGWGVQKQFTNKQGKTVIEATNSNIEDLKFLKVVILQSPTADFKGLDPDHVSLSFTIYKKIK